MQHVLYHSVDEMLAPETLSQLVGQRIGSVRCAPFERPGVSSGSGGQLLAVETDDGQGPRYVLKRVSLEQDWIMRVTEDDRCRSVALWQHGLLDQVSHAIEHTIIACARDQAGWAMLMRDVSENLVREAPIRRGDYERVLDALAVLHSTFWGASILADPALGLCDPAQYFTCLSPERLCYEREAHAFVSDILEGWELLETMVAADVVDVVRSLHRDPGPLCRALARYPQTLVHGDAWRGNLGLMREARVNVILLDWQLATVTSPAVDLANCLMDSPTVAKERAIAYYRHSLAGQLGRHYDESWWHPQLGLGLLGFFVQRGWVIPMFIEHRSDSEGERDQQRANLAWVAEQVRAAVRWL